MALSRNRLLPPGIPLIVRPPGRQPRANVRRVTSGRVPSDLARGLDEDALGAQVPDETRRRQLDELGGDLTVGRGCPRGVGPFRRRLGRVWKSP